jgi:hypothetical protein
MTSMPDTAAGEKYDRLYRTWLERQGPRAPDLEWRIRRALAPWGRARKGAAVFMFEVAPA